jgi:RimJ/RimL family protein N-acetyltransferase
VVDPNAAPALETARLRLRQPRLDDFEAIHAMWLEPKVFGHILGRASTREETWSGLLRYNGHWNLLGYGYWAVEEKSSGKLIGQMGFADYHRDITPSLDGTPELGWALVTSSHGRGYATEGLTAVSAWGDRNFNGAKTACIISPANTASIRVAEKLGYREAASTTYKGKPTLLYFRP